MQHPYLNLGAGKIIYPGEPHWSHRLVDQAIFQYPFWHNVDRNPVAGIDQCFDLFAYPWPLKSDSYAGAFLGHLAEHIPHAVKWGGQFSHFNYPYANDQWKRAYKNHLELTEQGWRFQDGWYAFFAELYRVLTDGAIVHILSPYGWSQGAIIDPTHTRLLTEQTFTHSLKPDPENTSFQYANGGVHFEMDHSPVFRLTEFFQHLKDDPQELQRALATRLNVAYEFYVKLRVVKSSA